MASRFVRPTVLTTKKKTLQDDLEKRKKQNAGIDDAQAYMDYIRTLTPTQQNATKNREAQAAMLTTKLRPSVPSLPGLNGQGGLSYALSRQALLTSEQMIRENRAVGLYDTEQVAYNPNTAHLASTDYLKSLQATLGTQMETSRAQDEQNKARLGQYDSDLEDWYLNLEGNKPTDWDLKALDTIKNGREYASSYELNDEERGRLTDEYLQLVARMKPDYEYQSQTPTLQARWDALDKEIQRRNTGYQELSSELRSSPTFLTDSVYTPMTGKSYTQYVKEHTGLGWFGQLADRIDKSNDTAVLYDYMMNPQYALEYDLTNDVSYRNKGYNLLTDDEKLEAAAAMAQGEETFTRWLSSFEATGTLTRRKAMLDKAVQENYALHPLTAVPMYGAARMADVVSGIMAPVQAGAAMLGYDDPNSMLYASNNFSKNVGSVQAEKAGELMPWQVPFTNQKFGSLLYNGVSSVLNFALARGIGGSGKAATAITQYIMSSQAASNTIYNALEEGQDPTEAVVRGMVSGAIEAFTEKYSIEALLKNPSMFAAFVGQNMATEASEEVLSSVLNTGADWFISKLYGHEDALTTEYEALKAQLGDPKEASRQVLQNFLLSLGTDAVLGGFTGGTMGAAVGAQTSAQRSAVGKEVSNLGNVSKLVDIGLTMDVNGESNPLARTIKQAEADGKKVSNRQVGRLYETMYRELDEQSRAVVTDTMRDAVAERMVELGDSPEVAQEAADAVLAVVRNEKPSLGQRQSMARAQSSTQVIKEIMFADDTTSEGRMRHSEWVRTADEKASAAGAASLRKMGELRQTRVGKEATDQAIQRATVNAQQLVAKKATDKKSMDVELEDGQSAEILQVSNAEGEAKVTIKGADGKKQTISASELRIKSRPVAAIVSYLDTTSERMSDEQANLLLHSYTGGDAAEHIADFNDAYAAGFMARDLPPSKRMDRRMAQQIAEQGRKDAEAAEQKRQATIGAIATGRRGSVTFTENMADAGNEKALKAVSGRLSDTQKKSVAAIKQLARTTGVNFVFFESQADDTGRYTAENGHYDVRTGTIYLDLNSGKNSTTDLAEYAILRTAGHELTHFMEHSSKEGYAALRDFVTTELTRRGEDFDALVVKKMDNAARSGAPLTRAGAISEVVADASELMLRDTKAIERLAKKDQGLMAKIKGFIQSFVQKVRDAFSGVDAVHEEARVMMQELAEEFQQKWDFALEEAVEKAQRGAGVQAEAPETVQMSLRDTAYLEAVQRGDTETARRMVDEAAKAAGYEPVKLYHGTRSFGFTQYDISKSDDGISVFVTDNERIAESYSGEGANKNLKDSVKADRYDFMQQPSSVLEPYVHKHVGSYLRVPTANELREYTDRQSAYILSAVDWVNDYMSAHEAELNHDAKQALALIAYYGEKLAAIPYAEMEDETDGYKIRMKYEDAVQDLAWGNRDAYDELEPVIGRAAKEAANNLIMARFSDPFFDTRDGVFVSKWDVTDKLGDKMFSGIYELYGDRNNLFEIEANDSNWNMIDGTLIDRPGAWVTTREVAEYAKKKGYHGALIHNVRDGGGMTAYHGASSVFIYFNNTSLKSADTITYDDSGNVIPLSERFNATQEDIRYSLRIDYQYTVDGARDFFQDNEMYHHFATKASDEIARHPRKKQHIIDVIHYGDEVLMCVVQNDGGRKFHLEDVAFIDVEGYNGRIADLTNRFERMYRKYGKERAAEFLGSAVSDVRGRFFAVDRGQSHGPSKDRNNRQGEKRRSQQTGRTSGGRDQRIGISGGTEEVTQHSLRDQTETPEFKRWFGNSKVVDEDGNPLVVYHGTDADFNAFDMTKGRANMDIQGAFFSPYEIDAAGYGSNVRAFYLKIENPASESMAIKALNRFKGQNGAGVKAREYLQALGYDGVYNGYDEYIVFAPSQIKSATDNVGTFDSENPDIRYSLRDMPAISTREYIAAMQPTTSMTDSEKWLLGKYQQTAEELREKEASLAEQIRLSTDADTPEEQQKAKNRAAILRTQANRLRNTLSQAERAEGFATIIRTSRDVVQNYLAGRNANQVADAVDTLEAELQGIQKQLLNVGESVRSAEAGQRAAYARGLFNAQALNQAAGAVKKAYNLRMSTKTLADRLALAYAEMYANDAQQGAARFYAALESLAQDILANSRNRYASPILDALKERVGSISISDAQEQELRNAGISMSEFRRVVNPVVNVTRGTGSDLSAIVSSAEYYGTGLVSIFSAEDSEGDMILKLYNVIKEERAKEHSGAFEGMSETESLRMVAVDVMGMVNLPLASADGNTTALRAELLNGVERNAAIAKKVDNVIEAAKKAARTSGAVWRKAADVQAAGMQAVAYYRAIDEQRRLMELQEQKKNITHQLRSEAAQKLLDEQTRYRQMIATDREVRKLTQQARQMQEKIATHVRKLDKLRRQETDYKNIPEAFKPAVDTLVSMFTDNFGTMVFDKQRADRLSAIYHKLLTVDGNDPMATLTPYYDPDVEADLEALAEWAEKDAQLRTTSGTRMEKAALRLAINKGILEAVDHITAIVTNAQNLFYAGKKAKFDAIGTQMGDALKARQDKKTLRGAAGQALTVMDNLLRTGNMTPVYFFEQLGNEVLSTMWDDIRQGQNAYAFAMRDGRETIQGLQQLYHYWDWVDSKRKDNVLEITTEKGRKLTFTREQALWVYATWKREQSNEIAATKHLTEGGIVYEGKKQEGGKVVTTVQSTPAVLSEGDIARITGWLTDEQKAYADGMVRYLSEDMAELGNRASMEMFGIRKYTESYYFPYRTAGDQLYQSSASGRLDTTSDSRLKHASFTHALTKGASAPLVMGDFSAAVEDHIAHMATYASFVLPIESMNRVLNYKVTLADDSRATVRSLIEQKYGESAKKYIATLLTDLNGGVRNDNRASGTDYLFRMYKKGAVAASLSTALQQPTSLFRAMAMISPKYIAASTFSKRDWDELTRYSGVAVIKEMGRFDTDVGRSNIDWLHKKHPRGFMERLDAASVFLPEQLDRLTWAHLWSAVKKEQADLHPEMDKQGEAFLTLCGERFNDIVDHTQVYDSILSRSQLMRGKDAMSKMTTSFMAEPTLAINMLYNAAAGFNKPGGKAKAAKVMAAVLTSNIAAAAMAALIQAWNDDDDKRSAQAKYMDKFLENALDNNNPLSMLPVVSDVWSMFQGYDVQRADMSLISEMYKAIQRFQSDNYSPYRKVEELVGTTAKFFGLPVKNLLRDGRRAYNLFTSSFESPNSYELSMALPWADDKATAHYEELFLAMHNGDTKREEEIRGYLTDVKGKQTDAQNEGVRDRLKERFLGGSMDEAVAKAWLKTHMGYDNRKAFETVDRWRETQENKGNEEWSYSIYNDFYDAVESGKNLDKEIKQLLDLGIEAKTLASNITTEFKPLLLELLATGKTSQAAALQAKILDAYVALGYDREKKLKDVKKWYSK